MVNFRPFFNVITWLLRPILSVSCFDVDEICPLNKGQFSSTFNMITWFSRTILSVFCFDMDEICPLNGGQFSSTFQYDHVIFTDNFVCILLWCGQNMFTKRRTIFVHFLIWSCDFCGQFCLWCRWNIYNFLSTFHYNLHLCILFKNVLLLCNYDYIFIIF
jgi:hypothetical protein